MFLRILNRLEEAVICILLVSTTLLVFLDVVMRFGFSAGFLWSQELTLHMSGWFVLIGASYGLKQGSHIGMDAFVNLFSTGGRKLLSSIGCALCLIYCGLILYGSWIYLKKMHMIGIELEDIAVPAWIAHSILLTGFAFLTIRIFILFYNIVFGDAEGFKHADEAKESMQIVEDLSKEEATI